MTMAPMSPRLELVDISKRYAAAPALDRVSLTVAAGEIHGLVGQNGAGKSTLMRIIQGEVDPDAGRIFVDGAPLRPGMPGLARRLGIGLVHQHFALFDSLTVAENLRLAVPGRGRPAVLIDEAMTLARRYGLVLTPDAPIAGLSAGERQAIEILRVLLARPRLLVLDEPTAMLPPPAIPALFATLRQLAADGVGLVYCSHRLDEIEALCDRVTVLARGRVIASLAGGQASGAALAALLVDSATVPNSAAYAEATACTEVPLRAESSVRAESPVRDDAALRTEAPVRDEAPGIEISHLSLVARDRFSRPLVDINLRVRPGQLVVIAGLPGNGQAELLAALVGLDRRAPAMAIRLQGRALGQASVAERRAAGLGWIPADRRGTATVAAFGLDRNLLLTHDDAAVVGGGWIHQGALLARTADLLTAFDVRAAGPRTPAASLSGGNLQRYVVARELAREPAVLVAEQPTWGLDPAAAARVRAALAGLRDQGSAILLLSSDDEDLFDLADAFAVMNAGRLSPLRDLAGLGPTGRASAIQTALLACRAGVDALV